MSLGDATHASAPDVWTDVLVVGGGPAGGWAALAAARAGASVVLVDKGYLGTSGATAPSNTGTWCVPPEADRDAAVARRWARTGGLADPAWMLRTVEQSYAGLRSLLDWGYAFPVEADGRPYLANLRGPDYMRFLRRQVQRAGVRILDHHPALELLWNGSAVAGAAGLARQAGGDWRIAAGAVVLATGGCAFFERLMGASSLTGDGYLMAAEAGASLSGMEFTGKYTLAPYGSTLNKGLPYRWASFYREDGTPLLNRQGMPLRGGAAGLEADIARAMLEGPVLASLDQADAAGRDWLRRGQPNCFLPHDRRGLDPFREHFRVTLVAEGTVRGTGGIRVADEDCGTDVAGLYVAGDAASRENVTGASSGGGAVNASWAMASGWFAGSGAARHAHRAGRGQVLRPLGQAGLRPAMAAKTLDLQGLAQTVRAETVPLDRNFFRSATTLAQGRHRVEAAWQQIRDHLAPSGPDRLKARETAAVTATARWSLAAAQTRTESRGVHRRLDHPDSQPGQTGRFVVSGLDDIRVAYQPVAAATAPLTVAA